MRDAGVAAELIHQLALGEKRKIGFMNNSVCLTCAKTANGSDIRTATTHVTATTTRPTATDMRGRSGCRITT